VLYAWLPLSHHTHDSMNELPHLPPSISAHTHPEIELGILPARSSKDEGRGRASTDITELVDELELNGNGLPSASASSSRRGSLISTGAYEQRYERSPSPSANVVDALPPTDEGWSVSFLALSLGSTRDS
jgi:hypothetical protein